MNVSKAGTSALLKKLKDSEYSIDFETDGEDDKFPNKFEIKSPHIMSEENPMTNVLSHDTKLFSIEK